MPKLHLVMPMAGRGSRFFENGLCAAQAADRDPRRAVFSTGRPAAIEKNIPLDGITFVVLKEHIRDFALDARIRAYWPDARIVALDDVTPGAAVTCQKGCEGLPNGVPVLFNDCDHLFLCRAFDEFCRAGDFASGPDGALLTFPSDSPAYSYLQYGENGLVCRTVEKQVVSHDAICGAYYFKDKATYLSACAEYLHTCQYKEFFVSASTTSWQGGARRCAALPPTCTCPSAPRPSTPWPSAPKTPPALRR